MSKRADSLYAAALLLLSGAARAAEPQCDRDADDAKPKCQKRNTLRKKTRRKAKGKK